MTGSLIVYGAYGYTGELVARRAVERGLAPLLAGRDSERLAKLARELGCDWRAFPLSDPDALRRGLSGAKVVLHCAGPFVRTARPMAEACIDERVHYVDLSGEIAAYEPLVLLGPGASTAGVMLLPGGGFDVVPSDCLAVHLVQRLPGARSIVLALGGMGRLSRGTARTIVEQAAAGDAESRAPARRVFDLGDGPVSTVAVPWPDTFTAPRSTGVLDVTTYLAAGPAMRTLARAAPYAAPALAPLLRAAPLREATVTLMTGGERGPSAADRAARPSAIRGEATDAAGARVAALLRGPNAYDLTALAAVEIAERALRGEARPGWHTPATAFGPDLVLSLPGVTRVDL